MSEPRPCRDYGKLIVVSNRLPFVVMKNNKTDELERTASAGGLVTAIGPVVVQGNGIWVGWPGFDLKEGQVIPESNPNDSTPTFGLRSEKVIPVIIDSKVFDKYYNGSCNRTFWPLFHSMPDKVEFCNETWNSYCFVNKLFAIKTVEALEKLTYENQNDEEIPIIWLQDYHLMLAANFIRNIADEKNLTYKLGFFLHIPFPSWDIFRLFPWADDILQGLLGCDLIGFQIEDYCLNFIYCCNRLLGCRVDQNNRLVEHGGRAVRVCELPIGIPFDHFAKMAKEAPVVIKTTLKLVLGVDRLDYTKGLKQRLRAFELFLELFPENQGKVALMQIAVPSRVDVKEYQDLKEELDQLVGRINGRFSTPNWSPIRYIYGTIGQFELAAFYRDSAVAMVTPLRDGMNLVAKEYVACQAKDNPGVLIMSPFAGASEMMHEALICNPYEILEVAKTINRALSMPEDERVSRMNFLRTREERNNVHKWMSSFLEVMKSINIKINVNILPSIMQSVNLQDFDGYLTGYVGNTSKLALLLDYDGTLAPLAPHPDLAVLPLETKRVLERLNNIPEVYISIISGRNVNNVKEMVGIEGLTYAGNHGLEILYPDGSMFTHPMPEAHADKVKNLLELLQERVCVKGAWVENKNTILTYHYREVPVNERQKLASTAQELIEKAGFKPGQAHLAIEARPTVNWNKGRASLYILRTTFGVDWNERIRIIYAGDDVTDEDAMKVLKGMAATFRVAQSEMVKTSAERRLPNTNSVLTMLKWVEKLFDKRPPREESVSKLSDIVQKSLSEMNMVLSMPEAKLPM